MTAVEWLAEQLYPAIKLNSKYIDEFIEQAKEMHKQEMKKCYEHGTFALLDMGHGDTFEQYYKETFVSKGSDELEQVVNDYDDDPTWIDDEAQLPQQEISDEEIENVAWERFVTDSARLGFIDGAKWYREQLKQK
jgi:transketolase